MPSAEEIAKSLTGVIGKNDEEATAKYFLDTGFPPLNMALSGKWDGGLPSGRVIEISGPPSAGKTALSTRAMAAAQRMGGIAGFKDHERSFSLRLAPRLGLDPTPGRFVYKKPETLEDSFAMMRAVALHVREKGLVAPEIPLCWVFDSLAAMIPAALLYDSKGNRKDPTQRNMKDNLALATACSQQLPIVAQAAEDLNICVIILNQLRTKPGVLYGDPTYTPGGDAKEFYYSQRIRLSAKQIKTGEGPSAEVLGNEVTGKLIKNKIVRPFQRASWRFMYRKDGTGYFDRERSLIDFLVGQKILEVGGGKNAGSVNWKGTLIHKEKLARDVESRGAFEELTALLPPAYEPEIVAEVDDMEEAA